MKCQGCCRFRESDSVWLPCLLEEEIQDLLDKNIPAVSISIERKIQPVANPKGDGFICAFFDIAANECKIYESRPFECQLYPFLLNLRDKSVILTVDLNCPYLTDKLNTPEFKKYTQELVAYLNAPKQISLLKNNPHILQAYEDLGKTIELKLSDEIK
ncbi:MAG: YkgJ family cysteine cluster protein [Candidatus Omnitrophica bacterium]|nr:YkgJ family cysteine cluster protein [Candidatus Omnitrophota bacterium]